MQVEVRFKSMAKIDISELSTRTGLAPSALRYYERCGLLQSIGRAGGKRIYEEDSVQQVALIDLLKTAGFTLSEIAGLIDVEGHVSSDWRERAIAKQQQLRQEKTIIDRALVMLQHTIDCPSPTLHDCPTHSAIVEKHVKSMAPSTEV